ncbi:hypothetical protein JAAARDRAFT_134095 [Jaapia argillacea MUCL 33604]|uniref:NADP-dependent oxidoreductase domain-containing protein n=1 Tax=Jaapia argillacea MUCL 33604 TaxID=933084 RepID=A0A067PKV4_9AGAM|nr:hypothetical protein JAAARDRAFT_134095 [Jaapia argillacea MUCL 33604]
MAWDLVELNDGYKMPTIAFGTWKMGNGQGPIDQVDQAISTGFSHVDTAQAYRNEAEAGSAIRDSGLSRSEIFLTTKYSGMADIDDSIQASLKNLGVSYVDLYLVHSPRLAVPDIPTIWSKMEAIKSAGYAKSIGISNFNVPQMETLVASAKFVPTVNQILLHPYVYAEQAPILEYGAKHGIVIEAYSSLIPLTSQTGGPVDIPVNAIAARLGKAPEQILLAWVKAKGAVPVTTSSKKDRLERYLDSGDIVLTDADIAAIDAAGAIGARRFTAKKVLRTVAVVGLVGAAALKIWGWLGKL